MQLKQRKRFGSGHIPRTAVKKTLKKLRKNGESVNFKLNINDFSVWKKRPGFWQE